MSARQAKYALVGVIGIFIVLAAVIAFKTPAYESDDEPGHVENIETLVSGHLYGIPSTCRFNGGDILLQCSGTEPQQAPLYYLLLAGWQRVIGMRAQAPYDGDINPAFIRGSPQIFEHRRLTMPSFLLWLRLANVVLGGLTILVSYFAVRLIATNELTPVVAAALVAFLPRFVFLSAFVTNDNLVNLLGAALVWVTLRFIFRPTRWRMAAVGAVVGLLAITKLSALPFAAILIVVTGLQPGWRQRIELLAVGAVSALGFSGWYFVQNTVRYGDPLARTATANYLSLVGGFDLPYGQRYRVSSPLRLTFIEVPHRIVASFWFQAGWNTFHWSWPVNLLFCAGTAAAIVGLINHHVEPRILVALAASH